MKGGVSSYQISTKRRWKGFVIAVLGLVILSMLVPLVFLLGFHNGFHSSGFPSEQSSMSHNQSGHIEEIIDRLVPSKERVNIPIEEVPVRDGLNESSSTSHLLIDQRQGSLAKPAEDHVHKPSPPSHKVNVSIPVEVIHPPKTADESETLCEVRFGSYCLWRRENKEVMIDSMVKKMKDRLFVARAYFPSIAKLPAHEKLSREMKQNIQDFERILSETTTDADLPSHTGDRLQKMEAVIARAKSIHLDYNNVEKKFRQLVDLTEDEANFHTKQSAFLYQLAVQTMPKSLHCLSMRLTVEYFNKASLDYEASTIEKFTDPELYHFVVFSSKILASSVLINSTVANAKESRKLVFHILTDRENYYSMKLWFFQNTFKESAVQVLNVEDYIPASYNKMAGLSLPEEFRVTFQIPQKLKMQYKTEYVSVFSHSHYLLPEIFKELDKVVVLDDDMLVQQDLSSLWNIRMERKVNGAVEMCAVRLGQLSNYLGKNNFNSKSCAWMSGLNVIDLARWRELHLTETFRKLVHELEAEGTQYEAAASRASLLTFQDHVHALDDSWVLSGLGHDYELSVQAIKKAKTLHYNGNMKPWLELGIPKYKSLWLRYLNREDLYLSACNVNP
ncbi:putative galacturonosyltransferase 7 isoform X2 [Silene latifolia]|uniref:putative galacturonosyltransferase 7 isoform X2 n=1 Tax=Silene latifolia TaxID=37657 RepID=UPI003D784B46